MTSCSATDRYLSTKLWHHISEDCNLHIHCWENLSLLLSVIHKNRNTSSRLCSGRGNTSLRGKLLAVFWGTKDILLLQFLDHIAKVKQNTWRDDEVKDEMCQRMHLSTGTVHAIHHSENHLSHSVIMSKNRLVHFFLFCWTPMLK